MITRRSFFAGLLALPAALKAAAVAASKPIQPHWNGWFEVRRTQSYLTPEYKEALENSLTRAYYPRGFTPAEMNDLANKELEMAKAIRQRK